MIDFSFCHSLVYSTSITGINHLLPNHKSHITILYHNIICTLILSTIIFVTIIITIESKPLNKIRMTPLTIVRFVGLSTTRHYIPIPWMCSSRLHGSNDSRIVQIKIQMAMISAENPRYVK